MDSNRPNETLLPGAERAHAGRPSAGVTFVAALIAIVVAAGAFFYSMENVRAVEDELRQTRETLRRTHIVLEQMGLRVQSREGGRSGSGPDPRAPNAMAQQALDQAKVATALAGLQSLRRALVMWRMEADTRGYPASDDMRTYADLKRTLEPYGPMRPEAEADFTFLSYAPLPGDGFLILAEARDRWGTFITVTDQEIQPWPADEKDR